MKYTMKLGRGDIMFVIDVLETAELISRSWASNGAIPDNVRLFAKNDADALKRIGDELDRQVDEQDAAAEADPDEVDS